MHPSSGTNEANSHAAATDQSAANTIAQFKARMYTFFHTRTPYAAVVVAQVAMGILTLALAVNGTGLTMAAGLVAIGLSLYLTLSWIQHQDKARACKAAVITTIFAHTTLHYVAQAASYSKNTGILGLLALGAFAHETYKQHQIYKG